MKKLIVAAFALFACNAFAQVAPTTQEEYTYVTKGYKVEKQNGLDTKKGYHWVDLGQHSSEGKTCNLLGLIRSSESKPCAILIYFKSNKGEYYLCMPDDSAPANLWGNYWSSLGQLGDQLHLVDLYVHHLLMKFADQ